MDRSRFLQEFSTRAAQAFPDMEIRIWEDGFVPETEEDREFVQRTNAKYAKADRADRLIGDFATFTGSTLTDRMGLEFLAALADGTEAGWEKVFNAVKGCIRQMESIPGPERLKDAADYEKVKDMLYIRLLNFTDNRLELRGSVYERLGDIAKVLYFKFSDDGTNLVSAKVPADVVHAWGIPEKEVWETAMLNTFSSAMPRIYREPEECIDPPYQLGAFLDRDFSLPAYKSSTLTTVRQTNGATALFYPGVMERIADLYNADFLVSFTSIDEAHLHKVGSISPRDALWCLKGVNKEFNEKHGGLLSRKVYRYFRETGELKMLEL